MYTSIAIFFLSSHILFLPPSFSSLLSSRGNKVTQMPTLHRLHLPASLLQSATSHWSPRKQTANERGGSDGKKVFSRCGLLYHCLNTTRINACLMQAFSGNSTQQHRAFSIVQPSLFPGMRMPSNGRETTRWKSVDFTFLLVS